MTTIETKRHVQLPENYSPNKYSMRMPSPKKSLCESDKYKTHGTENKYACLNLISL